MANSFWTEERQARLVELAAEKKTAGEIAMALGCTANAVVGRAYRTDVKLENRAPRKLALTNPIGSRDPAPVTLPYVAFLDPKNALPFERLRLDCELSREERGQQERADGVVSVPHEGSIR